MCQITYDFETDIDAAASSIIGVFGVFGDLFLDDVLLSRDFRKNAGVLAGTTLIYSIGDIAGELLFDTKYGVNERRLSFTVFCFNTIGVKFPAVKRRLTALGEKLNVERVADVIVDDIVNDDDNVVIFSIGIIGDNGEFAPIHLK